jgi:two-component system response regulator YesN
LIHTGETSVEGSFGGLSVEKEKRIIHCVKSFSKTELLTLLNLVFSDIISHSLKPTASQAIFSDLLSIINRVCKENDFEFSAVYSSNVAPYHMLSKFETFGEISEWIIELYIILVAMLEAEGTETYSDYVKKAIQLIKQHYSENISLSFVADRINVSSNYLSTLFKDEVGQGFSDYLIHFKLERAKSLLQEGKKDIKEIVCLCGFSDYAYFFKIFKKKLGVTHQRIYEKILTV